MSYPGFPEAGDERPASVCKIGKNLVQTSHCYYGK